MSQFDIAIIGSGPGGLGAAARAAERGISHILLEASPQLANTLFKFQKGKHVMDEPRQLPLRSSLPFAASTRESILDAWNAKATELGVKIRYEAEVTRIEGQQGEFHIGLANGDTLEASHVVLAIGIQGNPRRIGIAGEAAPWIQYQLDDPEAYEDETIVVVGAGDSAIENALALAAGNRVILVNRRDEFARAKEGNLTAILKAISEGRIDCYYNSSIAAITTLDWPTADAERARLTLSTPSGSIDLLCHRVIARLGATPPRSFLESLGVTFAGKDASAAPVLSARYESSVPGLYIVGALAGYPLIKQALNQGYEVIEFILGHTVVPADEPLLRAKFAAYSQRVGGLGVDEMIRRIQDKLPLLAGLTSLQIREFMLDSQVVTPAQGSIIFRRNDYTDSFYSLIDGTVRVEIEEQTAIKLGAGDFFGEMSLISGRRRSATVVAEVDCVLIETPRRSMNRLIQSTPSAKRVIDQTFLERALQADIAPSLSPERLARLAQSSSLRQYKAGECLFREGDEGQSVYLVRRGSLTVSRMISGREMVLSYVQAGNYVGEMALMGNSVRSATVRAAVATETIVLEADAMHSLLEEDPELSRQMERRFRERLAQNVHMEARPDSGTIISYLVEQGIGEATDVLLIDESLCVRCDNCEKACAATHGGATRLNREAGPTFAQLHVPTSCRHCEHPHCMKDCPPDAIHRSANGEVYIADNCIGCGNCQTNCPYGVIQMAQVGSDKTGGLWRWLLFGWGDEPGRPTRMHDPNAAKVAVKCDMCKDVKGGPACVRSCPTGAAIRVSPREFMTVTNLENY